MNDLRKLLIEARDDVADLLERMKSEGWHRVERIASQEKLLADIDAALAEKVEPVAWLHEVTDGDEQSLALSFSPDSFPLDTLTGWKSISHRPLIYGDTAPASGVREGMMLDALQRAQRVMHGEGVEDQGEAWDKCAQILDEAITRAADQVNADKPVTQLVNIPNPIGRTQTGAPPSASQPEAMVADPRVGRWTLTSPDGRMFFGDSQLAALREERNSRMSAAEQLENIRKGMEAESQPDTVPVPIHQLEHWAEYWNGSANEKAMSDALEHILSEIDAVLQAAQEAK